MIPLIIDPYHFYLLSQKCLKHSRFISFFAKNNLLNETQYGFTKSISTCEALIDFTNCISFNNNNYSTAVSIDLKQHLTPLLIIYSLLNQKYMISVELLLI